MNSSMNVNTCPNFVRMVYIGRQKYTKCKMFSNKQKAVDKDFKRMEYFHKLDVRSKRLNKSVPNGYKIRKGGN